MRNVFFLIWFSTPICWTPSLLATSDVFQVDKHIRLTFRIIPTWPYNSTCTNIKVCSNHEREKKTYNKRETNQIIRNKRTIRS